LFLEQKTVQQNDKKKGFIGRITVGRLNNVIEGQAHEVDKAAKRIGASPKEASGCMRKLLTELEVQRLILSLSELNGRIDHLRKATASLDAAVWADRRDAAQARADGDEPRRATMGRRKKVMKDKINTPVPSVECKGCGHKLNAATDVEQKTTPNPGALSICLWCGYLAIFADDMSLRDLTDQEMHEVAGDKRILEIQKRRAQVMKKTRQ
jgi:hypothetical protein